MMARTAVLAIDQGTTNSKALLIAADGSVVAHGSHSLQMSNPAPGWFEQDGEDLWHSVLGAIANCLATAPDVHIVGFAISNQRESVVAWDPVSGLPLTPVLGWQDGRTSSFCQQLTDDGVEKLVHQRTGLRLDPMFSAPKIRYLLDQVGGRTDKVRISTIDAYLIRRLTGADHGGEAGNAARTLLFDIHNLSWSEELLDVFSVPRSVLPDVKASNAGFGHTIAQGPLPSGVPLIAVLGDSHAALFGHGLTTPGQGKVTYGTGSSVMVPITGLSPDTELPSTVSTTVGWLTDQPRYAREGNIVATGSGLDTLATVLHFTDVGELIREAAQAMGPRLSFVPAFSGLGAPYWDRRAMPVLVGIGRETSRAQVAQAGLDAIVQQIADVVVAIEAAGDPVTQLCADGGPSTSAVLMQLQADLLNRPITAAPQAEASALGVARLAWQTLGCDQWQSQVGTTYQPQRDAAWRQEERTRWQDAVARSRNN